MPAVKTWIRRGLAAATGLSEVRAALERVTARVEAAAAASREADHRSKAASELNKDRVLALQQQADEDRRAVLDAINGLRDEQRALRADLTALSGLTQLTYGGLIDTAGLDDAELDRPALDAHIRQRMAGAAMCAEPFPHLVVSDLLPEDFHCRLLRAIPAPTFWRRAGYQRDNWHIDEDRASRLSETTWRLMHQEIAAHVLMPLLLDRFADAISEYWRSAFDLDASLFSGHYVCDEGRLLLRRGGYELKPHLDPPNAILTALIYLAPSGAPDAYGTDLYKSGPLPAQRTGIMYPAQHGISIEHALTVPFEPNTLLAFVTPMSVHGAKVPDTVDERFERISYQFLVCLDDQARRIVRKGNKQRTQATTTP